MAARLALRPPESESPRRGLGKLEFVAVIVVSSKLLIEVLARERMVDGTEGISQPS